MALIDSVIVFVVILGPLLALIAYVGVINVRYPGGWVDAVVIALVARIASVAVLYILAVLGFATFEAVGVPGV
jgi:hypothetical protein